MRKVLHSTVAWGWTCLTLLGGALLFASSGTAQEKKPADLPLEPVGRLVGGYWHIEGGKPMNAYHHFTWGPNKRTLHGVFYLVGEGGAPDPVRADSLFYWHPVKKKICDVAGAANGDLYEGEFTLDEKGWTHDFQYHSPQGTVPFRETWVFPNNDTYVWTLYRKNGTEMQKQHQATFKRVKDRPKPL